MAVKAEPSHQCSHVPLHLIAMRQKAAEGQSDKMASDTEGHMEQRYVIEFLHVEKMAPIGIHQHLLNVDGDQTVYVSTVRWWVVHLSSDDNVMKDKPRSERP